MRLSVGGMGGWMSRRSLFFFSRGRVLSCSVLSRSLFPREKKKKTELSSFSSSSLALPSFFLLLLRCWSMWESENLASLLFQNHFCSRRFLFSLPFLLFSFLSPLMLFFLLFFISFHFFSFICFVLFVLTQDREIQKMDKQGRGKTQFFNEK